MPDTVVRLGAMFPTPGYCDEEMFFFRLSGLSVPERSGRARTRTKTSRSGCSRLTDARDMVRRGEIVDMKTVVGAGADLI